MECGFRLRWALRCTSAVAMALLITACGEDSPAQQPTGPTPQPTPPPVVVNTPPTITELRTSSPRAEADQEIEVTAFVKDDETPIDQLTYAWSASPVSGTFSGNGPIARWLAPKQGTTPDTYTLTLTITEKYTSAGEAKENKVSALPVQVHYNDSFEEIKRIGVRFLTELFSVFSVTPEEAVQDFSDSCPGKGAEKDDVEGNRKNFHILSGTYADISIGLDADKTFARMSGTCVFRDVPNGGAPESVHGICTLTAVYENWRWLLCDSHFTSTGPNTPASLRYRVPGSTRLRAPSLSLSKTP